MNGGPAVKQDIELKYNEKTSLLSGKILVVPSLIIIDIVAIQLSLLSAYMIRIYMLPWFLPTLYEPVLIANTLENLWWLPIVIIGCLAYEELYQKRLPFWKETEKILKASTLAVVFTIALMYLAKISEDVSRTLVLITWLLTLFFLPLVRYFGKRLLKRLRIWVKPVLIIGAGKTGELICKALVKESTMGYEIIGYLDDNHQLKGVVEPNSNKFIPIIGTIDDAEKIISNTKVEEVIIAAPGMPPQKLVELTNQLQPMVKNVMVVPDLFGLAMNDIEIEYFLNEQVLLLNVKNKLKSSINILIKRAFDILVGSVILFLTTPIMLLLAIIIKLDSRGPILFAQERIGQRGEIFTCYKFRTMYLNGDKLLKKHLKRNGQALEEWQTYNKLRGFDPRLTKFGAILRRFSLDELPQIINVIKGEMSLVGPRPYIMREKQQMGNYYHDILIAKPGITGLWQVSGRSEINFEGRLKLDVWYVRNWSILMDIVLLLRTIRVVFKREGAY